MFDSPRVERILELSKEYAKISVTIRERQLKNQSLSTLLGQRIACYSKLIAALEIVNATVCLHEPRDVNVLLQQDLI
jgi:hypothetical protein